MFHVGQRVVCVNDSNGGAGLGAGYTCGLRNGRIYQITGFMAPYGNLILAEIEKEGWSPSRFRPLIERKTDISFAHEILRKVTRKDRVRA